MNRFFIRLSIILGIGILNMSCESTIEPRKKIKERHGKYYGIDQDNNYIVFLLGENGHFVYKKNDKIILSKDIDPNSIETSFEYTNDNIIYFFNFMDSSTIDVKTTEINQINELNKNIRIILKKE